MDKIKVGDECKADHIGDGEYIFGKITKIDEETGLAWADFKWDFIDEFCGDIPTRKEDGVWVFDAF
jgi:hypothetical protein